MYKRAGGAGDLLGQALARENMAAAWKRVKANKGSAGVDGRTVQETGDYLKQAWPDIRARLMDGSYRPEAVRGVFIPKPGGGVRELGIPTVVDRPIQQALLQVPQPRIDPTFSAHSHGFRPGRSAHGAVLEAQRYVQAGYRVVVDVDLEKFFDRVNHDILMDRLAKRIAAAGQSVAGRGGSGACAARTSVRALCRRLQRLCQEPPSRRAGAARAAGLLREACTEGERVQDGGGYGVGAQVPWLLLLGRSARGREAGSGYAGAAQAARAYPATDPASTGS
jgi:hypothetical protein